MECVPWEDPSACHMMTIGACAMVAFYVMGPGNGGKVLTLIAISVLYVSGTFAAHTLIRLIVTEVAGESHIVVPLALAMVRLDI